MAHRTVRLTSAGGREKAVVRAVTDGVAAGRLELRQLRYFVTLAEELHFGRAATREHIAPSALTAQLQRLERALGVLLVDRSPRRIALTAAGARFLIEARQILEHVDRAAMVAQGAALTPPTLRVGVLDEGYDAVRPVLRAVQDRHPELEIHQISAGVPEQCQLLADGRLDVGVGRVSGASTAIASELFRLDPLGVLVRADHPFATRTGGAGGRAQRRDVAARRPGPGARVQRVRGRGVPHRRLLPGPVPRQRAEPARRRGPGDRGSLRAVCCRPPRCRGRRRHVAAARTARTPLSVVDPVARAGPIPLRRRRWSPPPAASASRTAGARAPAEIAS